MFEAIKQGVVGLALFLGNWISPIGSQAEIEIVKVEQRTIDYVLSCKMDIAWNHQLEKLVDAGIPLRFRIATFLDNGDSLCFKRTFKFNIVEYTYMFVDSSKKEIKISKDYPMVLLALKDFSKWKVTVPLNVSSCKIEAVILPSHVSSLNRYVDMSQIWGQKKVVTTLNIKDKLK